MKGKEKIIAYINRYEELTDDEKTTFAGCFDDVRIKRGNTLFILIL
jgi:hypothetical protein